MAKYLTTDTILKSVADAIRAKSGISSSLTYPTDFISAIEDITTSSAAVLQSKTVTPTESAQTIVPDNNYDGLSAVTVNGISSSYIGSNIVKKSAQTYTPTTTDQTISAGQYLNGAQTIKGDSNLIAGNIASGKSIFGVQGTFSGNNANVNEARFVFFYDYDGTILYSYTASEFAQLNEMPANPDHSMDNVPLTSQGWNWTLANAKAQLALDSEQIIKIGQTYLPTDEKTHIFIQFDDDTPSNRLTFSLYFGQSVANSVTVDWGDGSTAETYDDVLTREHNHTYATGGIYHITLSVASDANLILTGNNTYSIFGQRESSSASIKYTYSLINSVFIGRGVSSIGASTFYNSLSLNIITIPNTITLIDQDAFFSCRHLKTIILPNNITLSSNNFDHCSLLENIVLPDNLTNIPSYCFQYINALEYITIPNTVTYINNYAFTGCRSLKKIIIPGNVIGIGWNVFDSCTSLIKIKFLNGIQSIGSAQFQNCTTLTDVIFPNSITSIGGSTFTSCYCLKNVTYPNNLTNSIVFSNCPMLPNITLPNTLQTIVNNSFSNCKSITKLIIPSSVTTIGTQAFYYCTGISEYHFLPTTPPTLSSSNAFSGIASDCIIYVPYSADHSILNAYKTATNWSTYASYMQEESQ